MNVVSAVANLQKEKDYYLEQFNEAQAVIKQLIEGPGDVEYIHPLDFAELLQGLTAEKVEDVYVFDLKNTKIAQFANTGKRFIQSVLIPAKTKNIW